MKRQHFLVSVLVLIAALGASVSGHAAEASGRDIAEQRLQAHLRHGINLSEWFAQVFDPLGYSKAHFDTYTTPADIRLIRQMGFDHVRLSIEPQPFFNPEAGERLNLNYLKMLDAAVDNILSNGLAVIVDIHPTDQFKAKLASSDREVQAFADFWRALAAHYADRDPDRVFFEVLNEPEFEDGYRWQGVQEHLAAAIRKGAPRNTIIVAGHRYSDIAQLIEMEPLDDPNVIYNFHFYEPHIFTHQGATWGAYFWHYLKAMPYPSTPDNVQAVADVSPTPSSQQAVEDYGLDRWDSERMEREIAVAAEWARQHHVPLTCNEFGVYRDYSTPAYRVAWIRDARRALEKYGIGWTMWDYQGGFGVVTKKAGTTTPDPQVLGALGLRPAQRASNVGAK